MTEPFVRTHLGNNPGIVGARWWQESLAIAGDPVARRQTLLNLAVVGASLLGVGVIGSVACRAAAGDDERVEKRDALTMQRDYGWNFGSETEALTFDGQTYTPFNAAAMTTLVGDLTPAPAWRPYYVPTLFQAPTAMPRLTLQGSTTPVKPLREVLTPINTPAMREAYRQGRALASLFEGLPLDRAVIADLEGPQAVAFAAGAASVFDPVFVFDNWPHPLGVVPSHLTLAAVAHYQPLFIKARTSRSPRSIPLFVLDRKRVTAYTSENTQFDNRYVARLPSAENLKAANIKRVLYVNPSASYPLEADDLNADFVEYGKSGVEVKATAGTDFRPDPATPATPPPGQVVASPDDWPPYYYGGDAGSHYGFWNDYRWNPPQKPVKKAPMGNSGLAGSYTPTPRNTMYSGTGTGTTKTRPATIGAMPVVVAAATGLIVGAAVTRSGSYGRYSSSWGGG